MYRYKLTLSYEGTNYSGFQIQKNAITIEEKLVDALFVIHQKEIKIISSGRTDKGVHAYGMVCHFNSDLDLSDYRFTKALNTYLPSDIKVLSVLKTKEDFHARYDAKSKTYQYRITKKYDLFNRNFEKYIPEKLDLKTMKIAAQKFIGKHDFFAFASYIKGKPTIKEITEIKIEENADKIYITISGNAFLRYMVRRMVGTLVEIGKDQKDATVIDKIFATNDKSLVGKTISPEGLYLMKVVY